MSALTKTEIQQKEAEVGHKLNQLRRKYNSQVHALYGGGSAPTSMMTRLQRSGAERVQYEQLPEDASEAEDADWHPESSSEEEFSEEEVFSEDEEFLSSGSGKGKGGRGKKKGKSTSRSAKAGLMFPVGRIARYMRQARVSARIGAGCPVYMAGVLEYIAAEILELAGNAARDNKRSRITPRHITLAIRNDAELNKLIPDAIASLTAGATPELSTGAIPMALAPCATKFSNTSS